MSRGLIIDAGAVELLNWSVAARRSWIESGEPEISSEPISQITRGGFLYLLSPAAKRDSRLLVIGTTDGSPLFDLPEAEGYECFQRLLKVALSQFGGGAVRVPIDWRLFHSGSLLSFQSNRFASKVRSRMYVDLRPEGTDHVFAFALESDPKAPLTRERYSADVFTEAVIGYEEALSAARLGSSVEKINGGQLSVALTKQFGSGALSQGVPFTVWRDSKLTADQLRFLNAPFDGPLRIRGAAGTGKTLVLCLRFLKEIYGRLDAGEEFRAAFIAHAQETADQIRGYLSQIDERGVVPRLYAEGVIEVSTLHSIANGFVNIDAEGVQPLSLDGAEGRALQMEIMGDVCSEISIGSSTEESESRLFVGIAADPGSVERIAFLCDVIDEFSSVLESYGVRDVDMIADRYMKASVVGRVLARTPSERHLVLELYRGFRRALSREGVVSLDQFISDFLAYLNSFRWDAVRSKKGFDFVFADELHLFNRQERQVFAYLMRDPTSAMRVALAYDPRQSPRSAFLPEDQVAKDSVWVEARLAKDSQRFELKEVFRYTPEILRFLARLNRHFPADDLSEEWGLEFGESMLPSGEVPEATLLRSQIDMAKFAVEAARRIARRTGERVAVLCLDHERFAEYQRAGLFKASFVSVGARDEAGAIQRFSQRAVLSMPEYVAGLQFDHVLLLDANAATVAKLGSGVNGIQRFVSSAYLGASRARLSLRVLADESAGGFAAPVREAIEGGFIQIK